MDYKNKIVSTLASSSFDRHRVGNWVFYSSKSVIIRPL